MRMEYKTYTTNIAGTAITVEVGKLAEQPMEHVPSAVEIRWYLWQLRPLRNPGKE